MTNEDNDVLSEIDRLREDVKQLREIVNILVNVVMEEELEEEEENFSSFAKKDGRFDLLN
ncbi:MAG: hypothetical protein JSV94_06370 [Methanobacteriota archaeon]|nr:MAG: hypothetical protein JSV94_06370 [Euryarchaeota archaeon]